MIPARVCILYTHDPDLVRRVRAFVRTIAQLRHVSEPERLEAVLEQSGSALLIVDLRAKESRDLLEEIQSNRRVVVIIGLGVARSEPLREAQQSGIYAAEDVQIDRQHFQALVGRAFDYLKVMEENEELREELISPRLAPPRSEIVQERYGTPPLPLLRFPRVFRRFENVDSLLASVVENVADAAGVTRVGIFSKMRNGEDYRLRAGLRCLPETYELEFDERDPLVRWFERQAHLISRDALTQTVDRTERLLLRRSLDAFGAEVIVPLYARGRIIGWLFFGHRLTGHPFDSSHLEGLTVLAEHVSTVLENALLYSEITLQKTLAETLLKSIPPGIIATDENAIVRWFNPTAEQIFGVSGRDVLNKPVETVGSRLAGFIRETLESKATLPSRQWIDQRTRRSLLVETRRLDDELGTVAVVYDLTVEEDLREKQALLDRAAFWTDLAASMSHEIRNPLVAIKTFAQLLPERFDDADFRKEFNEIVVKEIDRLDKIITQINNFAHPPELVFKPIDLRGPVRKAIAIARERVGTNGVAVETSLADDLPKIVADEKALTEAFAHLVANAAEATSGQAKRRITLTAKPIREGSRASGVVVTVRDNGKGIAPELKDKIFSPFVTTKARGIGLGLPIVKRTVFDHQGRVDVESTPRGTEVSVLLPAKQNGR
ncbi:MAG TPA: ATP-binding protein [Chthoniobacterales bacterium]|jgi:nitrogen-specific signal transduction histidine kinase